MDQVGSFQLFQAGIAVYLPFMRGNLGQGTEAGQLLLGQGKTGGKIMIA
jgi:hypothetical protein